jgi:hypothetical protein
MTGIALPSMAGAPFIECVPPGRSADRIRRRHRRPLWGTSTDSRRRPTPSAILWDEPTFAQPPGKAADAPIPDARRG